MTTILSSTAWIPLLKNFTIHFIGLQHHIEAISQLRRNLLPQIEEYDITLLVYPNHADFTQCVGFNEDSPTCIYRD